MVTIHDLGPLIVTQFLHRFDALLQDLTVYMRNDTHKLQSDTPEEYDLLSILDTSRISIITETCQWQHSIRITGKCLISSSSIEPKYLETIISQLHYYGPYMFLTDDVILAHAKPEDGVNCLDVSMGIFCTPVRFSECREAKLVIILAAEDQEKHLKILQDILKIISDSECMEQLFKCSSALEAIAVMQQLLT